MGRLWSVVDETSDRSSNQRASHSIFHPPIFRNSFDQVFPVKKERLVYVWNIRVGVDRILSIFLIINIDSSLNKLAVECSFSRFFVCIVGRIDR